MLKMQKIQKKYERKNARGITLIALIITIIVLLILAGVALAAISGEDGILQKAVHAKEETQKATAREKVEIAVLASYGTKASLEDELLIGNLEVVEGIDETTIPDTAPITYPLIVKVDEFQFQIDGDGGITGPVEIFEPEITPEPETGAEEFEMANGVIEIKWLRGGTNYTSQTPNPPKIKEEVTEENGTKTIMELVRYDEASKRWIPGEEYSYVPGSGTADNNSSEWANAEVTTIVNNEEIKSYFVWIPRYAYRIVYFKTPDDKKAYKEGTLTEEEGIESGQIVGYSDSRGIVDKDGVKVDNVESTTKINVGDYFMVHPAFTTNADNGGGWEQELEGLWIGKYEAARSDATNTSVGSTTTTTIKVQPNVRSFRNDTIGNMYNYAISYSENLKSHMLKNSEWGAVAYLTDSKYGRNGTEVIINNNSNCITGQAGDSVSAPPNTSTNTYNTEKGVLASSTGNVYGIYDLSGGVFEYVASYYKDGDSSMLSYGSSFADKTNDEYSTAYEGTTESSNYKYGDATYETHDWNQDGAYFVSSDSPFFMRGGVYYNGTDAGVFYFNRYNGHNYSYSGFRLGLAV